ncbi:MAG: N-acetyltransferase [Lentilactobacillus diolivorans]|uniref:GNAT family N-acetyltransferase n=1 Tax=Lentilactobacillus diolivorans TaxID=179838 RepID=UPI0039E7AF48
MIIRTVRKEDYSAVSDLIRIAFSKTSNGYRGESELVDKIRQDPTYRKTFEVVADNHNRIIGYGLLSEIQIENKTSSALGLCLAPLAVAPVNQKSGIGGAIINELDNRAVRQGYRFISVLGWPDYYPRFGYQRASQFNIKPPFPVPDETYMIKPLVKNGLKGIHGTVKYLSAFD